MKIPHKFITLLLLCLFVVLVFGASNSFCGSSIEDLRKAAEKGAVSAQLSLGRAYYLGKDVPKDVSRGRKMVSQSR